MKRNKRKNEYRHLIAIERGNKQGAEQFRTIRSNIHFSSINRKLKTIVVSSPRSADGKSMIAANLAIVFSQEGKRVLLVDADMRNPSVHQTFELVNNYGLSNFLINQIEMDEIINKTYLSNLEIITSGTIPPNPSELLSSKQMQEFIETAKSLYDLVIFDTPPILVVTDSTLLANQCDGALLVVRAKKNEVKDVELAQEQLKLANANLIGAILNEMKIPKDHYYYK